MRKIFLNFKYINNKTINYLMLFFFAVFLISSYNLEVVNAATTTYGFSDTDYEREVGGKPRTPNNQKKYPFVPSNITISTPTLKKTSSGQFQLVYQYGYPITRGGLDRYLEYRVKFSNELAELVSGINVDPIGAKADPRPPNSKKKYNFDNRITQDSDGAKVFSSGVYLGGGYNGGDANVYITLKRSFVPETAFISSYMISSTEVSRPVYPSFEALRILNYDKFGQRYNEELLKSEKELNITKLSKESAKIVQEIKNANLSQKMKDSIINRVNEIVNEAIKQINNQNTLENKTLETIENIADKAIASLNTLFNDVSEVSIISLPNLDFGAQVIQSKKSIHETVNDQTIEGLLVLMNQSAKTKLNINLSISEFKSANHTLKTMYLMQNQMYAPNTTFSFTSTSQTGGGKFVLTKKPADGVKLVVYPENLYAESYNATATWTIVSGPGN